MTQRAFYDDASDRVFITLIKGSHRVNLTLAGRDLDSDDTSKANQLILDNIDQLARVPIG